MQAKEAVQSELLLHAVAPVPARPRTVFMRHVEVPVGARKVEVICAKCNMRESCLTGTVPADDLDRIESVVYARRRVKRGERLFGAGDEFESLYAIRSGFFKTSLVDGEGREQVTGFFMGGELLGLDGLGAGRYNGSAIALEDSEVCMMPYRLIEEISSEVPALQRGLHRVLAREIVRDHGMMLLLGSMCAEERLANFLLNLGRRLLRRGFSSSSFILRMTRDEIGSYLGLKLETVSRLFSTFQRRGLLEVRDKHVSITDIGGLERLLAPGN
jgi:CRP/FNR family transcriptional regulator, anaerobic regulatory protein